MTNLVYLLIMIIAVLLSAILFQAMVIIQQRWWVDYYKDDRDRLNGLLDTGILTKIEQEDSDNE